MTGKVPNDGKVEGIDRNQPFLIARKGDLMNPGLVLLEEIAIRRAQGVPNPYGSLLRGQDMLAIRGKHRTAHRCQPPQEGKFNAGFYIQHVDESIKPLR